MTESGSNLLAIDSIKATVNHDIEYGELGVVIPLNQGHLKP